MEEINITPFSEEEARQLTEEIKNNPYASGKKIVEAYRRRVWEALRYRNFIAYAKAELGLSKTDSSQLKRVTSTTLSLLPELGSAAHKIPDSQKALLYKLPSEQRSEGFKEAQRLAKDKGKNKPTAEDVKQVVVAKLSEPLSKVPASSRPPTVTQSSTTLNNDSESLAELREGLRRKTRALETVLQSLNQAKREAREKDRKLERKDRTLHAVLEALDRVRTEARMLKDENKQLKNLLNSLGGTC